MPLPRDASLSPELESDIHALLPGRATAAGNTRRTAIQVALGVGYAASVLPALAQTAIRTPADGLDSGPVTIDANGFAIPAYRSAPAGKTGLPVILVIQEIFGVHEYIADVTRRLARLGYLAIAPDLYRRQGDATQYTDMSRLMSELVSKVPDEQVLADLDATVRWAGTHGGNARKVGITGFCWGGRQIWLYAAHNPNVKAGVAWYGRLVGNATPLTPRQPIDVVGQLKAPVLGLYGGADTGIPVTSINEFKQALAQAAQAGNQAAAQSRFILYPDAPHAFHADYRPSYRAEAAKDGWQQAVQWFKQHGLG
ncbi:MAG: Carboxymethylenebutenolidase [Paracidovorax wautersii]|uniref:Carboxymethylenebutenolidase n=1 Tax=Paracidovorax wautersii TaxID=1177982 RepID=A0A7V8JPV7_9BURK|nr:MAG: Carboxymethylenebutenolidase [Paracidovorax wautersii]